MTPFVYPPTPHVRRHGPQGYADYLRYQPWLRDEFTFRCVYCLRREKWWRVAGEWQIDHFLPVAHRPELKYRCAAKARSRTTFEGLAITGL